MNVKISKIKNVILGILFALSSMMLSFQLTVGEYEKNIVIITSIISFCSTIYLWYKTSNETFENIKNNKILALLYIGLSCIVWGRLYSIRGIELKIKYEEVLAINPFRLRFFILSIFAIIYLGIFICNKIKKWIFEFYKSMDSWDKKAYVVVSLIWFSIILVVYNLNANWYLQYDKVYSLDSGWCFSSIFPKSGYYDIRHPLLSIFTFPIFAIVDTFVKILFYGNLSNTVEAIIFQFMNVQFLILIGLQIKKLTQNKVTFLMYMLSFPTILYSIFFEKYQLCVFLLFMYVFAMCSNNNKEKAKNFLISAAGCMPTSCVIGIAELITSGKWKEKIVRIIKIVIATILIFICLGRASVFKYGLSEIAEKREQFSNQTLTIKERAIATTKMIQSSLTALPSNVITTEKGTTKYWWDSLETKISITALAIMAVIIIGIVTNKKSLFVKISSIWSAFAFVLFVGLNWSPHETPLFNIYFSWSLIPLFVMGMDFIIEKLDLNRKMIYGILFGVMLIINITTILDIQNFLFTL